MLESLLLAALGAAAPLAAPATAPPSLELLEFLGEFGDDEEGLFDEDDRTAVQTPAGRAPKGESQPVRPAPPEEEKRS